MYMRGALFVHVACVRKWCLEWTSDALVILYNVKFSSEEEAVFRIDLTGRVLSALGRGS